MSSLFSKCAECANLIKKPREEVINGDVCCKAFPNGIPWEAFSAKKDEPCTEKISFEKIGD